MNKMKEIDKIATTVAQEVVQEIYTRSNNALEYSDLDIEGDDYNNTSSDIMDLVIKKIQSGEIGFVD
jgi:hypothetical protein|tara:strand:- start:307 stop:507 length:201 start_codon:yes stop_codon:yes gene_type:complete